MHLLSLNKKIIDCFCMGNVFEQAKHNWPLYSQLINRKLRHTTAVSISEQVFQKLFHFHIKRDFLNFDGLKNAEPANSTDKYTKCYLYIIKLLLFTALFNNMRTPKF